MPDTYPSEFQQSSAASSRRYRQLSPDAPEVYSLEGDIAPATATGRILVRFREGVEFGQQGDAIAAAGFRALEPLSYAPHAGWVVATSGRTADSLSHFGRLAQIPGVENVEPQMIRPAARKG
jgi:hypothetical protein